MSSRIFIGGIPHGARERDVERFFRGFGRLRSVNMKIGYAFVEFEDDRDADDAVYELNGKELLGERVNVERAKGIERRGGGGYFGGRGGGGAGAGGGFRNNRSTSRTEWRLVVENLSSRVSWQDLKDLMRDVGAEVTYANAHNRTRNEGVCEFASLEDMERALDKMEGREIEGRKIHLYEAKRTQKLTRDRISRSLSRSPRRSRSRSPRRRVSNGDASD